MIYTSYYGNRRKYDGFYRISISRSAPEQSYDLRLLDLAPSSQLLQNYKNGITNEEEYTRRYLSSCLYRAYLWIGKRLKMKKVVCREFGDICCITVDAKGRMHGDRVEVTDDAVLAVMEHIDNWNNQ